MSKFVNFSEMSVTVSELVMVRFSPRQKSHLYFTSFFDLPSFLPKPLIGLRLSPDSNFGLNFSMVTDHSVTSMLVTDVGDQMCW